MFGTRACPVSRFSFRCARSRLQFTLQPSSPGAAVTGSAAGSCDLPFAVTGLPPGIVYNEAEEDAEAQRRTTATESIAVGDPMVRDKMSLWFS